MRSSFLRRPPLRLTWKTENFMSCGARGGGRSPGQTLLVEGADVVDRQAHLLADGELRVAALALAAEFLLQREDRLGTRERIERHAPLDNLDEVVGIHPAKARE